MTCHVEKNVRGSIYTSAINLYHLFFSFNLYDILLTKIRMFQCVCISGSLATVLQYKLSGKECFLLQLAQIAVATGVNTNGVLLPSAGCT